MGRNVFLSALFIALVIPALVCAHVENQNLVDVRIISDSGDEFTKYRTYPWVCQEGKFFYMEAVKGQRYSIQVTNRLIRKTDSGLIRNLLRSRKISMGDADFLKKESLDCRPDILAM